MLAQSFMSAADLGLTEPHRLALQKVLVLLETGEMKFEKVPPGAQTEYEPENRKYGGFFNMASWAMTHGCGTVACIGGTAELIGNVTFTSDFGNDIDDPSLRELFMPSCIPLYEWRDITVSQAARALRSYLTTGDAKWAEAVA